MMKRTFAPLQPPARQQDPEQPINTREAGRRVWLRFSIAFDVKRERFQQQQAWVRDPLPSTEIAALARVFTNSGYGRWIETANEFLQIRF
jgi:hypothetical protein